MTLQEALSGIEQRFDRFRHSVPDERDRHRRYRFMALPYERLSRQDRTFGIARSKALRQLENFIAACQKCGALVWDETRPDMKPEYYYWQSATYPDLVLSRSVFVTDTRNIEI